ncbi:MAG TPA: MFS transporter [Acidimicrobiales bacterium]|nr:MFS transporter [Acidimicrobiales bacterium]
MSKRRLFIDLTPLQRFPQFRLLWFGLLIRTIGNQLTVVAVPYQIYRLTHSSLDVGLVSISQLGPLLIGSLIGGNLADSFDKRRLLIATQVLLASTSVGLALNSSGHASIWPLFVCSSFQAGFSGIDSPTTTSLSVRIVDRETLVASNALWQMLFQVGQVAGPAIAGLLLIKFSIGSVYWIDVATFGISLIAVLAMRVEREVATGVKQALNISEMLGGFRYLKKNHALQGIFLADLDAMVLGWPRALFPAMGIVRFHGGAGAVGLLYAAPGIGSVAGALVTGWVSRVKRVGLAVLIAVAGWGIAITLFGLVSSLTLALILLGIAGAFDVFSAVFRGAILQLKTPREILGRMQGVQISVVTGGPRLGDLEHGAIGSIFGSQASVFTGGIACIAGVFVLARLLPGFTKLVIEQEERLDVLKTSRDQVP